MRGFASCMVLASIVFAFTGVGSRAEGRTQDAQFDSVFKAPQSLEVCFSPNENCDKKLLSFMEAAQSTIDIAIYNITLRDLPEVLLAARKRGVRVRLLVDRTEAERKTSIVDELNKLGFAMRFGNVVGLMHNKFTIVDGRMVQTGSFNYTLTATNRSAENQLYIAAPTVVRRYQDEFDRLWSDGKAIPKDFTGDKDYPKD